MRRTLAVGLEFGHELTGEGGFEFLRELSLFHYQRGDGSADANGLQCVASTFFDQGSKPRASEDVRDLGVVELASVFLLGVESDGLRKRGGCEEGSEGEFGGDVHHDKK